MRRGDTAIRVEGVSKRYLIGHNSSGQRGQETLRDALTRSVRQIGRTAMEMARGRQIIAGDEVEEFWALDDVSFDVGRGEVVGIIGRNGAGKSTLLKVLSRITEPTRGRVTISGRVSSLLEVGTGFHPELTGRENIFLNGAILGMTRAEVRAKFDEIIAFAEIERFLDTPVKRYSSGMYVRLAFSVAAHLQPEILIVDEVLAVGDAEFQKKCLGKMHDVSAEGRTVLFVSHNLQAIERLCTRGILLRQGQVIHDGSVSDACQAYLASTQNWQPDTKRSGGSRQGTGEVAITQVEVLDAHGKPTGQLPSGEDFVVRIHYQAHKPVRSAMFGLALLTASGSRVFNSVTVDGEVGVQSLDGAGSADLRVSGLRLAVGHYIANLSISPGLGEYYDYLTDLPLFDVVGSSSLPKARTYDQAAGAVFPDCRWSLRAG